MRQTSLMAYHSLDSKKINQRQKEVYQALEDIYPACNRQIAKRANLPINVVTPRMGELVEKKMVEEAYKDVDPITGRRAIFWKPAIITELASV